MRRWMATRGGWADWLASDEEGLAVRHSEKTVGWPDWARDLVGDGDVLHQPTRDMAIWASSHPRPIKPLPIPSATHRIPQRPYPPQTHTLSSSPLRPQLLRPFISPTYSGLFATLLYLYPFHSSLYHTTTGHPTCPTRRQYPPTSSPSQASPPPSRHYHKSSLWPTCRYTLRPIYPRTQQRAKPRCVHLSHFTDSPT